MKHGTAGDNSILLIERVLMLKSLNLFADTPEAVLAEISELLHESIFEQDMRIFNKGETGNCLYIIFKGQVRVHMGDQTLALLKENDFFGELSLLDTETRSASVTAVTDTLLLRLDQEPFYELMENRMEVARGVIKTLCQRIRALNEKMIQQQG